MNLTDLQQRYIQHPQVQALASRMKSDELNLKISGLSGSSYALVCSATFQIQPHSQLIIMNDADEAGYMYNDIKQIVDTDEAYYFPSSYKKAIKLSQLDTSNEILRTEVLNRLANNPKPCIVVSYPEALMQKVVSEEGIKTNTLQLKTVS